MENDILLKSQAALHTEMVNDFDRGHETFMEKLGDLGFFGSSLPQSSGGADVSNVAYGLILHELERGDSGLRSFASVQGSLVMYPIHAFGSDDQKDKWLSDLGSGKKI